MTTSDSAASARCGTRTSAAMAIIDHPSAHNTRAKAGKRLKLKRQPIGVMMSSSTSSHSPRVTR